jgi:hypothetical protein
MEKIMKLTIKVCLIVAFFCSAALAGDQGSGGYGGCTINCPPPPCTENCGQGTSVQGTVWPWTIPAESLIAAIGYYVGLE